MIQCPECGTEYTVQPDVCAKCGYHFSEEDCLPDPFEAAMRQEQESRAQQQEQREAYLKQQKEKSGNHPQAADSDADTNKAVKPEQPAKAAPKQSSTNKNTKNYKKSKKKSSPAAWIGVLAVIGLFIAAFFYLWDDLKPKPRESTDGYVYMEDGISRFYREGTAETITLTDDAYRFGQPSRSFAFTRLFSAVISGYHGSADSARLFLHVSAV